LKFLEAAHVKDLLSVLRWAQNPRHRMAGLRVAQLVAGIGIATAKRVLDAVDAASDPPGAMRAFAAPPAAAAEWAAWLNAFDALRDAPPWPGALDIAIRWYLPQLRRLHDDAAVREGDLTRIAQLAAEHRSCEAFLAELTLDPPQATSDESGPPLRDEDYLILSTIHAAKGQEWTSVFVLNAVDGCIPSDMATGSAAEIDEERRVLYVAMTRARRHLHVIAPQRFYVTQQAGFGDRHLYGGLTRFIPPTLAHCFESAGSVGSDEWACAPVPVLPPTTIDAAARARSLWA
ncbi:MAG TPA: ATP-dependent helicase, partial [Burkholderiaceae bacterium]|nr:ATP-dependent helicase [Burkholderiaceae bacterium]